MKLSERITSRLVEVVDAISAAQTEMDKEEIDWGFVDYRLSRANLTWHLASGLMAELTTSIEFSKGADVTWQKKLTKQYDG